MMAMIPLVSGQLSTANSTWPAIMDSANVLNTCPLRLTALAIRFNLRCWFLSLATNLEKEWLNILKFGSFTSTNSWKMVSPNISEWESCLKNYWRRASLIGWRIEILSVLLHLPSRGGRYKLRVDMEHLQGIFITQNVQPLRILWLKEQSSAIVVVW